MSRRGCRWFEPESCLFPDLTRPEGHKFGRRQVAYAHGTLGMQLGGADPDFSAKAELPAVVETGGRVDGGEGGVGLAQKARGVGVVVGANDFGVVRAVTGDVSQRVIQRIHDADRKDQVMELLPEVAGLRGNGLRSEFSMPSTRRQT